MKKLLFAFILLLVAGSMFAQPKPGTSMKPILSDLQPLIDTIENSGQEIVRIECDILKDQKESQRYLYTGYTYGVFVYGDDRIETLDLEVYKQDEGIWKLVDEKYDAPGYALILVKPDASGLYKAVVRAIKFYDDNTACHYALILYHE